MDNNESEPKEKEELNFKKTLSGLLNPIPLTSLIILLSVLALIGADLFGFDKGHVLQNLADPRYARGLITYLFSVGTIGAVVVLIIAALLDDGKMPDRFQRAKEVMSLLIGLFGTIIGFYFGSQVGEKNEFSTGTIQIIEPMVPSIAKKGEEFTYVTFVKGGSPPYSYEIRIGQDANTKPIIEGTTSGWIKEVIAANVMTTTNTFTIRLDVKDSLDNQGFLTSIIRLE